MKKNLPYLLLLFCLGLTVSYQLMAAETTDADTTDGASEVSENTEESSENAVALEEPEDMAIDSSIEALKKEVLSLNRDLFILEEDLLFPANTQFSVFLSVDAGNLFVLDSVQLKIDDKTMANHLYTERELAALLRGGVQRLFIGNLPSGEHEVVAFFVGVGPAGRDYQRGKTIVFEKTSEPQFIEFSVLDNASKEQPEFEARVWE